MRDDKMNLVTGILLLIVILLTFWTFGCGIDKAFEEVRPNYLLNTSQEGTDLILGVVLLGIDTYNENYGECPRKVNIVMRSMPFDCDGRLAAGSSYGSMVDVGVDANSECNTIMILMHELSHACRYLKDTNEQPNWTWELNDISYQLFLDGKCKVDENGLYESYVWR